MRLSAAVLNIKLDIGTGKTLEKFPVLVYN